MLHTERGVVMVVRLWVASVWVAFSLQAETSFWGAWHTPCLDTPSHQGSVFVSFYFDKRGTFYEHDYFFPDNHCLSPERQELKEIGVYQTDGVLKDSRYPGGIAQRLELRYKGNQLYPPRTLQYCISPRDERSLYVAEYDSSSEYCEFTEEDYWLLNK